MKKLLLILLGTITLMGCAVLDKSNHNMQPDNNVSVKKILFIADRGEAINQEDQQNERIADQTYKKVY